MSYRQKRKINSKTVQKIMSWVHARFRNWLLSKTEEFGKIVITSVSEAYTSTVKHAVIANILRGIWVEIKYLGVMGVDFRLIEI